MENEQAIIALVAMDRLSIPVSSMSGKLDRRKKKLLEDIDVPKNGYQGERCYARIESVDLQKARGMRDGIAEFTKRHPKYGAELNELIEEKREERETHMYFGMHDGSRLSDSDYLGVMQSLGFSEQIAKNLYGPLMDVSRGLSKKRREERRILTD